MEDVVITSLVDVRKLIAVPSTAVVVPVTLRPVKFSWALIILSPIVLRVIVASTPFVPVPPPPVPLFVLSRVTFSVSVTVFPANSPVEYVYVAVTLYTPSL